MEYGKISSWIWFSLLSLATIYVSIQATTLVPVTMRQELPVYAVLENIDILNSSRCRAEIDEFRNAVDNQILWGLRGIVYKILSLNIFARLSKLSYTIYLIHPVLITSIYSLRNYPLLADEIMFNAMFSMIVLVSFIVSIPLIAAAEIPFMSLLQLYKHLHKRTK